MLLIMYKRICVIVYSVCLYTHYIRLTCTTFCSLLKNYTPVIVEKYDDSRDSTIAFCTFCIAFSIICSVFSLTICFLIAFAFEQIFSYYLYMFVYYVYISMSFKMISRHYFRDILISFHEAYFFLFSFFYNLLFFITFFVVTLYFSLGVCFIPLLHSLTRIQELAERAKKFNFFNA